MFKCVEFKTSISRKRESGRRNSRKKWLSNTIKLSHIVIQRKKRANFIQNTQVGTLIILHYLYYNETQHNQRVKQQTTASATPAPEEEYINRRYDGKKANGFRIFIIFN
jgi:hypothetical protein